MFNKRLIATLTLIATIASLVVAFAIPAAAADTYTVTAENYGTTFKPVGKNPFVTDKLELDDAVFTDSDMFGPFQLESKYWQTGDAIQFFSTSNNAVWTMPVGMKHTGITFVAPKTGTVDITIKAWKELDNATVSRVGIGINTTHYGENDVTDDLTTTPSEKTFTYEVTEGDVIAMIAHMPNGGDGGNLYFIPTITYHEEVGNNAGAPDTSDVAVAVALVAFAAATTVVVSKKRH